MTRRHSSHAARGALALALSAMLAGCAAVGPNYAGAPQSAAQATARGAFLRGGHASIPDAPIAAWWETLRDPQLDQLIQGALTHSPNIAIANATIAQARAGLAANRTAVLPTISASASAPYINMPATLLNPRAPDGRTDIQRYSLGFDASWELDLFGGTRRKIEAAAARADAAEAGLADAQVSLSAEVARAYIGLRTRQAQLGVMQQQAAVDARIIALADQRYHRGTAPMQPADQARAQAAQTAAQIASTRAEITVLTDQLAVLTGQEPGALDAMLAAAAPVPVPPAQVAIGDPALLLRNRPDIRIAERQLAAANADIGVSMADKFPKISFMGLLGLGGGSVGDLVDPGSMIALALPRISWSLFDGGRVNAQVDQRKGALAEAEARYQAAVLTALGDAESSLTRFGSDRIELGKALEAEKHAAHIATLQQQRFAAGTANGTDALAAQRQRLQLSLATIGARSELATDYVAVNKALGLGWQPATRPAGAN